MIRLKKYNKQMQLLTLDQLWAEELKLRKGIGTLIEDKLKIIVDIRKERIANR